MPGGTRPGKPGPAQPDQHTTDWPPLASPIHRVSRETSGRRRLKARLYTSQRAQPARRGYDRQSRVPASTSLLFEIFVANILPVFLVASVGFLLARFAAVDVRALARLSLHGLAPVLIFNLLVTSPVGGAAAGRMVLFSLLVVGAMATIADWPPFRSGSAAPG